MLDSVSYNVIQLCMCSIFAGLERLNRKASPSDISYWKVLDNLLAQVNGEFDMLNVVVPEDQIIIAGLCPKVSCGCVLLVVPPVLLVWVVVLDSFCHL